MFCNNLVTTMTNPQTTPLVELTDLETKLDQFIEHYNDVKDENILLKTTQASLIQEKASLLEKTNLARSRVEAMISRLKSMEQGS